MKLAIIFDSQSGTTEKAAAFIAEGAEKVEGVEAKCFSLSYVDSDYVKEADGVILGSPTYMASATYRMTTWLQTMAPALGMAGKLGGAYATEMYIHGGAENVISTLLTHEMVYGMMTYSGGGAAGAPVIHLGPVGMSQNIEDFKELFVTYGTRFAGQLAKINENA